MNWTGKKVLVTGGASFIGSHLTEALIALGADVRIVDDFSSGKLGNIAFPCKYIQGDLRDVAIAKKAVAGMEIVFHLAADHGGRGYVDLHQSDCAGNLILDGIVFKTCLEAVVEKVVYASSGCIYPNYMQDNPIEEVYLTEKMAGPPYDSDNMYGWAKLMGEKTLQSYYIDHGMKSASCRYFTVYGPRGKEDHAVMAMIARAFVKQDPFVIWGTGEQVRNWTYIDDIVQGTIRAAEKIEAASAVNLGTMERTTVMDCARGVLNYMGHEAEIKCLPSMPTGPYNRVADNRLAEEWLGWKPHTKFIDGLHKTIDWYVKTHDRDQVANRLTAALLER